MGDEMKPMDTTNVTSLLHISPGCYKDVVCWAEATGTADEAKGDVCYVMSSGYMELRPMDDDPSDEMKPGLEPSLPWWFWPIAVLAVVASGLVVAYARGEYPVQ